MIGAHRLIDSCLHFVLVMDSQTPQSSCYTNLINEDDLGFERTNEISEHQEASPQVEVEHTIRKSCRGSNFTMVDDNLLVEAWLYVSMDAVQGNQQKNKVYWKRICDYFHERKTLGANRNQTSLMNRWSTIQLAVNKFCGFLAQIEKRSQSGLTEQDKVSSNYGFTSIYLVHVLFISKDSKYVVYANEFQICQARQMFVDIQKSPFNFEHSWLILRFHPKWLAHLDNIKLKKKPVVINLGDEKVPHKAFEEIERPIGGKAENEKRKSKEKIKLFEEACEQDKEMFFLKQEEVRLRERELRLREKTLRLEEEREIKEFMLLDISQLDEDGKEYVCRRKKAILQGEFDNPSRSHWLFLFVCSFTFIAHACWFLVYDAYFGCWIFL
jgi:hypothetical protein